MNGRLAYTMSYTMSFFFLFFLCGIFVLFVCFESEGFPCEESTDLFSRMPQSTLQMEMVAKDVDNVRQGIIPLKH